MATNGTEENPISTSFYMLRSNSRTVSLFDKWILAGNTKSVIVYIGGGEYNEKITILQNKPFVVFYGSPTNMPTLTFAFTAQKYGTVNSVTVIVESDYFVAANLIIKQLPTVATATTRRHLGRHRFRWNHHTSFFPFQPTTTSIRRHGRWKQP
ncbi:hypothetical protein L3X38_014634 [Prunus dulcis]|uniref:pectinesterase n=1 Tax=Prunus dulcis TaxID=3755 RepID=A0AAD4WNK4_PRUDU|nr:hypothetical protein L3X38_014634 [Prunus dulcis]